jgi:formylglycine-generating enzyme required for sulfatase activity
MKKSFVIVSIFFLVACVSKKSSTQWEFNDSTFEFTLTPPIDLTKSIFTTDLKLINGGSFNMPKTKEIIALQWTVASFLLSDHEVTNKEYREFIIWTKRKAAADLLAKTYPEKRLLNGNYNEDLPIDWNDPVIQSELFLIENTIKVYNKKKLTFIIPYDNWNNTYPIVEAPVEIYPDTLCIEHEHMLGNDYRHILRKYWSDPRYDNYPVVGVSWIQAWAYCAWRTDRLNEELLIQKKIIDEKSLYNTTEFFIQLIEKKGGIDGILFPSFRLPTEAEWILATKTKNYKIETDQLFAWDGFKITSKKGDYLANFNQYYLRNSDPFEFTAPVKSFPINGVEMYDLCGNVAEWVQDHPDYDSTLKVIKGGDWSDSFEQLMAHKVDTLNFNRSSSRVGFRVAMDKVGSEYIIK